VLRSHDSTTTNHLLTNMIEGPHYGEEADFTVHYGLYEVLVCTSLVPYATS